MDGKLILVGCGNMGFAMLSGWLKAGKLKPDEVLVVEPNEALRRRVSDLKVEAVPDAADLPQALQPDLVMFAVKPQVIITSMITRRVSTPDISAASRLPPVM